MRYPNARLITVWECGYGHQHKTPMAAQVCIERHVPREPKLNHQARDRKVVLMRLEGMTYKALGGHFGLSPSRITQIYNSQLRRLRHPHWFEILFTEQERRVRLGMVEDNVVLKDLFLRLWKKKDGEAM